MKYTFNLQNIKATTTTNRIFIDNEAKEDGKRQAEFNFAMEGISVTVECDVQEMGVAAKSILDMRNAFVDGTKELVPIVKEAVIEIGKIFSDEAIRHRQIDHDLRMKENEQAH